MLASMDPSTPSACVPWWHTHIQGAWLIEIDGTHVYTILDAQAIFCHLSDANAHSCTLLFLHPKIAPDMSNKGLPIMLKSDLSQFTHN
jgi:hypothetical protein